MIIKVESYKIFSEIYCPIMPAPLELFFGDGCRSVHSDHETKLDNRESMTRAEQSRHIY